MDLVTHHDHPPLVVAAIDGETWRDGDRWHFRFTIDGTNALELPASMPPARADSLWRTTCLEAFVGLPDAAYIELNFSPSGQWAAYRFDDHRQGMRDEPAAIEIWIDAGATWLTLEAAVACEALEAGASLGLSAVIEERDATSYWALGHPDGAPDFHDRACFTAVLADIARA